MINFRIVAGTAVGGSLGTFFHKGLGMSKDDLARFDEELDGSRAAVAILARGDEEDLFWVSGLFG